MRGGEKFPNWGLEGKVSHNAHAHAVIAGVAMVHALSFFPMWVRMSNPLESTLGAHMQVA
jgi:hypothetical protein